jgi:hypothetical protein
MTTWEPFTEAELELGRLAAEGRLDPCPHPGAA